MARGGGPGGFDINALMKQAQQMQAEMLEAQEKLKDEVVEASAGGGMVKVKMGGDLTLREIVIDPEAIDPEEAELLAGDGPGRGQRGPARRPGAGQLEDGRDRRRRPAAASAGCWAVERGPGTAGAPRRRALAAAGDRPADRAAARLPPPARARRRGLRPRRRDPRSEGEGRPLRRVLQPRRGPAVPDLRRPEPRPGDDLRGRGAGRRDPDRAHPRIPRPLPRARRRPLADRRRRRRRPEDRRAAAAGRARRHRARSSSPPTPPPPARRPPSTSPTCCAAR